MTKPNLKLAVPETPRDVDPLRVERAELRRKIADKLKADAAVESAKAKLLAAEGRIEAATSELEKARTDTAKAKARAVAAASAGREMDSTAMHDARAKERDAVDAVEISVASRDALAAKLPDVESAAHWAANAVIVAANKTLVPAAARLLEQTRELRLQLAFNKTLLIEIFRDQDGPVFADTLDAMRARDQRDEPLKMLKEEAGHFVMMAVGGTIAEQRATAERIAVWWKARREMWVDAAAPIPPMQADAAGNETHERARR